MIRRILRFSLSGVVLGLSLALAFSLTSSAAVSCPTKDDPKAIESCSASYFFANSGLSAVGGQSGGDGAVNVNYPQIPNSGNLTFGDMKLAEDQAFALLSRNKQFRVDISPHTEKPNFDTLVRQFDYNAGFNRLYPGEQATLQQKLDQADRELRQARDVYAFLAVYANITRFKNETSVCIDPNNKDDRCNFAARMRESLREAAYLRMIFGQQFTAAAMGLHFDAGEIIGGEAFVKDEVKKLEAASAQYKLAEQAVMEGTQTVLGNNCFVADFYTEQEWALVSRAVEGFERAQHHIAVRKSYLDGESNGPVAAENTYQNGAMAQYVQMIGVNGLQLRQAQAGTCAKGVRPDNNVVAEMVANMLDTRQSARALREGRNVFGFDVRFTPARPYRTAVGSNDTGLYDEALTAAGQAKEWQNDSVAADREFDRKQETLRGEIEKVKGTYDKRLTELTGCSYNQLGGDEPFFACVTQAANLLKRCEADNVFYAQCVAAVPTGLLRQAWDNLRAAQFRINKTQKTKDNIALRSQNEEFRNTTITGEIDGNARQQAVDQFILAQVESVSISAGFPGGVNASYNPFSPWIAQIREEGTIRDAQSQMKIENANSKTAVDNLALDASELEIDIAVSAQEYNAQMAAFETLAAETIDTAIESSRAKAYINNANPDNDPSYRLVRDSARLRLARQLEYAARVSYMAAKRAEYEYAARLSASNFRISDIYRARTADDIIRFLTDLKAVTDNLIVKDAETQQEDFTISLALHVLGLTDDVLTKMGFTGAQIQTERARRVRQWVAQNTFVGPDGKPVLRFTLSTSLVDGNIKGVFANVIQQGYERFWLHEMAGIGLPKPSNKGLSINILTSQPANLVYRRVAVTQAGIVHLRSRSGCILDYRLIHPAALLGLEWPSNQLPESATADLKAAVNGNGGEPTPAFLGRPVSATDWQIEVFAGAPQTDLPDLNLQELRDIEIKMSTVRASRTPGQPKPSECVRVDK